MLNFLDMSYADVQKYLNDIGEPKYRADQLFKGYYRELSFDNLPSVPKTLKERLKGEFVSAPIQIEREFISADGTKKFLYRLCDGNLIEGVLMEYKYGATLCVSTQVGCRMGCSFCASTRGGLIRNLTAGEILAQVLIVNKHCGATIAQRKITNVVLMGSGEPLDNFDNVIDFLYLVTNAHGINISSRNISVSTCGLVDRVCELADLNIGVTLSVSLHAADQKAREQLMPIARTYDVVQVVDAAKYYFKKTGRRVIFEYAVVSGINVADVDVEKLAKLVAGFPCHVNIILLNPIKENTMKPPDKKQAYRFIGELEKRGVSATLRRQMGVDINGACGQLRQNYLNNTGMSIKS